MNIFERVNIDNSLFNYFENDKPKIDLYNLSHFWELNNIPLNHIDTPFQKFIGNEVELLNSYNEKAINSINYWDKLCLYSQIKGDKSRAFYSAIYEVNFLNNFLDFKNKRGIEYRILDIGGGYGRIAPFFNFLFDEITYVNIDLCTTSLICSHSFLKHNIKDKEIFLIMDNNIKIFKKGFYILPMWYYNLIPKNYFDLIININSMQEMTQLQIDFYLQFINKVAKNESYFFFRNHINRIKDENGISINYKFPYNWKIIYDKPEFFFDAWSKVINKIFQIIKIT
jgi:SAM-dependent methyltransferase